MKHWIIVFLLESLFVFSTNASFAQIFYSTQLTANQEVPAVATPTNATGTGFFILNDDMTELQFFVTVCDLTGPITLAHFHRDRVGSAGPPVRTITGDFVGNTAAGVWKSTDAEPLTSELVSALLAGEIYVNVHTAANPAGEIRGQIGNLGFTAALDTTQAVPKPPTPSSASGTGSFSLNPAMNELRFDITVDNLTGPITLAHFHKGAPGEAGGPVRTITDDFNGNTASGYWSSSDSEPLTEALVQDLLDGNIYVNVHTAANPAGEIRGQVILDPNIHFTAQLTVNQEAPAVVTPSQATGTAAISLDDSFTELDFRITVTGLTGPITLAHFHRAAPGEAGGPVRTITGDFDGNTASGKWQSTGSEPLTPELVTDLLKGNIYLNIHTAANPAGEVRGQIGDRGFGARLDSAQEVPPVEIPSSGTGTGAFWLNAPMTELKFDITVCDLTGAITNAHFHNGAPRVAGPPVRTILSNFAGHTAAGIWKSDDSEPLSSTMVSELLAGNIYVNVHTAANAPGEIRGQVNSPDVITSVERIEEGEALPDDFVLFQNFPNPFNPTTEIRFDLNRSGQAVLKVFNLLGQHVATLVNENLTAGSYKVTFDSSDLPSGVYVYQLEAAGQSLVRKMLLLR